MKIYIKKIYFDSHEFIFYLEHKCKPVIESQGKTFTFLDTVFSTFPQLLEEKNLTLYVDILNFFSCPLDYIVITDKQGFIEKFSPLQEGSEGQSIFLQNYFASHGPIDLNQINQPAIIDNCCVFYVEHDYLKIPYRVSAPYPFNSSNFNIQYSLLN